MDGMCNAIDLALKKDQEGMNMYGRSLKYKTCCVRREFSFHAGLLDKCHVYDVHVMLHTTCVVTHSTNVDACLQDACWKNLRFMQEDMQEDNLRELCRNQSQFLTSICFLQTSISEIFKH